jgi:hypothetical protein
MVDAQYDGLKQENYVEGYAIIEWEEEKDYGWWMCGASTAIYQWILTNAWLQVTKLRNHSKRYSNLYTAYINHEKVETPWIDSAVYYGQIDLTMKNITPNPIILVMNYDGSWWWQEEVFTLSLWAHKWAFEFISWERWHDWWCYSRLINGKKETSCYKEIW